MSMDSLPYFLFIYNELLHQVFVTILLVFCNAPPESDIFMDDP